MEESFDTTKLHYIMNNNATKTHRKFFHIFDKSAICRQNPKRKEKYIETKHREKELEIYEKPPNK